MEVRKSFSQLPPQKERVIGGAGIAEMNKTWTPNSSSCTIKTLNGDVFEAREENGNFTLKINGRKARVTTDGGFSILKKPISFDEKKFARGLVKVFEELFKPENQIDLGFEKEFEEYLKKSGK